MSLDDLARQAQEGGLHVFLLDMQRVDAMVLSWGLAGVGYTATLTSLDCRRLLLVAEPASQAGQQDTLNPSEADAENAADSSASAAT